MEKDTVEIEDFMLKMDKIDKIIDTVQERNMQKSKKVKIEDEIVEDDKLGIGLDVGTGFLVGAGYKNGNISYKSVRNAFISIPKKLFNPIIFDKNNISYLETNSEILIIGDDALDFARIKNCSAQRPLEKGILNPHEKSSALILKAMFSSVLSTFIRGAGETLVFSVPGNQLSNPDFDTTYHTMSIISLCRRFNVTPIPLNEAYAVAISELGTNVNTALSFSFGAGLVNCCLTFKGINVFEFSMDKSGDFIDKQSAKAVGEAESVMSKIKETELDLSKDEFEVSSEERALIFSYRFVVQNTLEAVKQAFTRQEQVRILEAIPIIVSGGTTIPKGFLQLFNSEIEYVKMPFKISKIIQAENPLFSVSRGCLLWSNSLKE